MLSTLRTIETPNSYDGFISVDNKFLLEYNRQELTEKVRFSSSILLDTLKANGVLTQEEGEWIKVKLDPIFYTKSNRINPTPLLLIRVFINYSGIGCKIYLVVPKSFNVALNFLLLLAFLFVVLYN